MLKLSNNPVINTATRLVAVAVLMFAFVFVVMVPLYNVLCDALGINGKTDGKAYTSVQAGIDESRLVTVQFVATNNEGMPWEFGPTVAVMKVHPGAVNDTVFFAHNTLGKGYGGAGDSQHIACQGRAVLPQDRVFLFQPATAGRGGSHRDAVAVYR